MKKVGLEPPDLIKNDCDFRRSLKLIFLKFRKPNPTGTTFSFSFVLLLKKNFKYTRKLKFFHGNHGGSP